MKVMELPHTPNCLVCGRSNLHGLQLSLHVDPASGQISTAFVPAPHHIGFEGIVHGGILATVLDEAMVWAATWSAKRFCVAGEMTVRFRQSAQVGNPLRVTAQVDIARSRLITTTGRIEDQAGQLVAEASGKYVPMDNARNRAFIATLVDEPSTAQAAATLRDT